MENAKELNLQDLDFEELKELLENEECNLTSVSWGDH
jgi:hypothetical protein